MAHECNAKLLLQKNLLREINLDDLLEVSDKCKRRDVDTQWIQEWITRCMNANTQHRDDCVPFGDLAYRIVHDAMNVNEEITK
jgi:hypothetical protein